MGLIFTGPTGLEQVRKTVLNQLLPSFPRTYYRDNRLKFIPSLPMKEAHYLIFIAVTRLAGFQLHTHFRADNNPLQKPRRPGIPSLRSLLSHSRSSVSPRKELVDLSGTLALVAATQRTQPSTARLQSVVGLVFTGSTGQ